MPKQCGQAGDNSGISDSFQNCIHGICSTGFSRKDATQDSQARKIRQVPGASFWQSTANRRWGGVSTCTQADRAISGQDRTPMVLPWREQTTARIFGLTLKLSAAARRLAIYHGAAAGTHVGHSDVLMILIVMPCEKALACAQARFGCRRPRTLAGGSPVPSNDSPDSWRSQWWNIRGPGAKRAVEP